jgi:hypothetical protein
MKLQIFSDRAQKIEDLVKLEIRMEQVEIFHGQVNAGISEEIPQVNRRTKSAQ